MYLLKFMEQKNFVLSFKIVLLLKRNRYKYKISRGKTIQLTIKLKNK